MLGRYKNAPNGNQFSKIFLGEVPQTPLGEGNTPSHTNPHPAAGIGLAPGAEAGQLLCRIGQLLALPSEHPGHGIGPPQLIEEKEKISVDEVLSGRFKCFY